MSQVLPDPAADRLRHFGGRLCLALANSVLWRRSAQPRDLIGSYADLLEHLSAIDGLPASDLAALAAAADRQPDQAAAALGRALELRELLFRLLSGTAAREAPGIDDLQAFNEAAAE